jgi:hypothetical protein
MKQCSKKVCDKLLTKLTAVERVVGDGHFGLIASVFRVDDPDIDLLPPRYMLMTKFDKSMKIGLSDLGN